MLRPPRAPKDQREWEFHRQVARNEAMVLVDSLERQVAELRCIGAAPDTVTELAFILSEVRAALRRQHHEG